MKVLITKYAVSCGVTVMEGDMPESFHSRPMFCSRKPGEMAYYFHGDEFQLTKEEAVIQVEKLFVKREASLRKSLEALHNARIKAQNMIKEAEL